MFKRKPLLGFVQRPVCEKVMDRMQESWRDWGDAISRCDESTQGDVPNVTMNATQDIPSNVNTALDRLDAALSKGDMERGLRLTGVDPMVNKFGEAQLYHCAWCGVPSAALKRCTICHKVRSVRERLNLAQPKLLSHLAHSTRYCNATCQKNDWKRHRGECKKVDDREAKNP